MLIWFYLNCGTIIVYGNTTEMFFFFSICKNILNFRSFWKWSKNSGIPELLINIIYMFIWTIILLKFIWNNQFWIRNVFLMWQLKTHSKLTTTTQCWQCWTFRRLLWIASSFSNKISHRAAKQIYWTNFSAIFQFIFQCSHSFLFLYELYRTKPDSVEYYLSPYCTIHTAIHSVLGDLIRRIILSNQLIKFHQHLRNIILKTTLTDAY